MTDEKRMNIYFIRAGEYIKIGIAQNIKSRISALQTGQAVTIEFCGAKRNLTKGEARKYERKLHISKGVCKGHWIERRRYVF